MAVAYKYQTEDMAFYHKETLYKCQHEPSAHEDWELIFLKKGDVSYVVNGKEYRVGRDHLIITRFLDYHSMAISDSEPYERYMFRLDQNYISPVVRAQLPKDVDVVNCQDNATICDLFRKYDDYVERFEGELLKLLLINLVEEILCNVVLAARKTSAENNYTENALITRAVQYINENITKPISLKDVADELNIAQSYLHRQFNKYMKVSPKKFIVSRKLILARRDIGSGEKPVEVGAKYGFYDYSSFYRNYTHYFGHKPSEAKKHKAMQIVED